MMELRCQPRDPHTTFTTKC